MLSHTREPPRDNIGSVYQREQSYKRFIRELHSDHQFTARAGDHNPETGKQIRENDVRWLSRSDHSMRKNSPSIPLAHSSQTCE